ncbi:hypothetical protein [Allosalinactinospora lopnorensis]|uniref:hypothetical protein n=1 Tax=Allosalinactinospora lopnorensis TaxID=1352348 RepID=UPI000623DF87|nr:hypothetical protein [Allosalinactinospora lopnorensis]
MALTDEQKTRPAGLGDRLYEQVGRHAADTIINDILDQAESYQHMLATGSRRPDSEAGFTVHDVPAHVRVTVEDIIKILNPQ